MCSLFKCFWLFDVVSPGDSCDFIFLLYCLFHLFVCKALYIAVHVRSLYYMNKVLYYYYYQYFRFVLWICVEETLMTTQHKDDLSLCHSSIYSFLLFCWIHFIFPPCWPGTDGVHMNEARLTLLQRSFRSGFSYFHTVSLCLYSLTT